MARVITQNSVLAATGVIWEGKVADINALTFQVVDNGGGSTITFETSTDDSSWSAYSTGIYTMSSGAITALGASTTTSKGLFLIDLRSVTYLRISVSTYVSGYVTTQVEESNANVLGKYFMSLATGLTAQGSTQAGAWPIQARTNVFSTVAASTGALLPSNVPKGEHIVVKNNGANTLKVYPPVGYAIDGGSANASVNLTATSAGRYVSDGAGNFWTV